MDDEEREKDDGEKRQGIRAPVLGQISRGNPNIGQRLPSRRPSSCPSFLAR